MEINPNRIEIASDVHSRDGIGIEVYEDNKLILEIFRDDTDKSRVITLWNKEISLADMEYYINVFKEEIPWGFIEY
ncbi:hypothetical protein FPZ42_17855 [Mucilaginibacter achroorhodeus]|uniref:Uncharacterized protein n=1 Tax=Mucilaginibacter achroorhodeus TaxID=2599294 RepID=A0A563U1M1_9SPHI|nr:hypothetical protein [Mucilaginibacter achroorhodeus]TWR24339.1 hypothetical protein FPZ42_17855 [Mucilaginibacter achroorhodeus]